MNSQIIIVVAVIILIKISLLAWFYLVNIYETIISVHPKSLKIPFNSAIEIKIIPLNSFGRKAILRNTSASFEIISGDSMVKIMEKMADRIRLQSLSQSGKVEILVTPEFGMFPSKIVFEIDEEL